MRTRHVNYEDEEGCAQSAELPASWRICGYCNGDGSHSRHLGVFTGEQMQEDPEFAEDYMEGLYDRPCEKCEGTGKVLEINRNACTTDEQKAALEWLDREEQYRIEAFRERKHESLMLGESPLEDWDGVEP